MNDADSLVGSGRVALWIVKVEVGEFESDSLPFTGVEAVSTRDVRRVAAAAADAAAVSPGRRHDVARRRDDTGLVLTRTDHVRSTIYTSRHDMVLTMSRT